MSAKDTDAKMHGSVSDAVSPTDNPHLTCSKKINSDFLSIHLFAIRVRRCGKMREDPVLHTRAQVQDLQVGDGMEIGLGIHINASKVRLKSMIESGKYRHPTPIRL